MQHVFDSISQLPASRGGGRVSSAEYRRSLTLCDEFEGLSETTNRYQLLLLVKQAGKAAGFSPRVIQLLDYYMAFTRDADWEQGSRPIVYQSLARTALDLGISERQVQRLEQELFLAGALTWHDSGNHKRYGQRDNKTGRILFAFGVDLTPLAHLQTALREKLQQKRLHDAAWLETKRQISWYRRQIRSLLLEWEEGASAHDWQQFAKSYDLVAVQIRTHLALAELRSLLARHKELHVAMLAVAETLSPTRNENHSEQDNSSCKGAQNVAHYNYSTQELTDKSDCSPQAKCFQESVAEPPVPTDPVSSSGLQHVTLKQAILAASDRFRTYLPTNQRPLGWADLVEAGYRLRAELHISQGSWGDACEALGRVGAALCLVVTDQATLREHEPALCAPAYFRGMVNKARRGELKLHNSIFGLAERAVSGADNVGKAS